MNPTVEVQTPHQCDRCGATDASPIPNDIAGWAHWGDERLCHSCADIAQVAGLLDRTQAMVAYLSSDGTRVTTWTGGTLMYVVYTSKVRSNWWHVAPLTYVLARDVHGAWWYGRGAGAGMVICMHPRKHAPPADHPAGV